MPETWGLLHVMVGDCLITCLLSNGDNENKNVLDVIGTVSKIMMMMLIFFLLCLQTLFPGIYMRMWEDLRCFWGFPTNKVRWMLTFFVRNMFVMKYFSLLEWNILSWRQSKNKTIPQIFRLLLLKLSQLPEIHHHSYFNGRKRKKKSLQKKFCKLQSFLFGFIRKLK